jgi:hypothetical protein
MNVNRKKSVRQEFAPPGRAVLNSLPTDFGAEGRTR